LGWLIISHHGRLTRKKAEEELEKYRLVVESLPDGIITLDLMGNVTSVNDVILSYGYKKEEVVGKSLLEFIPKKYWSMVSEHLTDLAKGKSTRWEVEVNTKQGMVIAEFRSIPIKKRGKIVGFQSIIRGITKQKLMEEELRESEEKYRLIFENSPDGIITLDLMGNVTSVNDVVLSYGYKKEDLIGKSFLEFVPFISEKHRSILDEHVASVISGKIVQGETELSTPKGMLTMWFRASPMKKMGEVVGFQLILIDITKRKKAEEALKESEKKLRDVIDTSPDGIVWVDTTGKITLVNERGFELTRFSRNDLIGKNFIDVEALTQESKEKILESFMKRIEGIDTPPYEVGLVTKNGEVLPFELSASPICEGDKIVGVQAVFRDLKERKRAEEILRESEEKYRKQFEETLDAIFLADAETGIIIDCNRAASELVGREESELVGKHQRILHPPQKIEGEFTRTFKQHLKEKEGQVLETQVITKKGEIKDVAIKANVFELKGKKLVQGMFRDITERKQMEEKLRESEEKFRNLFESIQDPVGVFVGREGRLIEYNTAFKKLAGYADEELKDKMFLDFVHPDDHVLVLERYRTEYSEEELPLVYEIRAVNKKGEIIPLEISVSTYKKQGRIIGIEIVHRDITARKKMEEELRESEERLRNLYESIPDALAVYVGREGRLIEYNNAFKKWSGHPDEGLKDKIFLDFVHPDDQAMVLERYRTEYSEEELPLVYEIRAVNKKGEIIPLEISVSTYKKQGRIIGIEIVHRDITARKKMEEELRESEERLRNLYESIPDALAVYVGREGRLIEYNNAFKKWSGHPDEGLKDKIFLDFVHPDDQAMVLERYRTEYSEEELPLVYEIRSAVKNGKIIPTEISVGPYKKQGRIIGINVMHRDITARKEMEMKLQEYTEHLEDMVEERTKELRESQERLLKSERLAAIGELATMVGHDLRNPLAAIQNASYYLKMKLAAPKDEKVKKMFRIVEREIEYANSIAKDLLDFSRVRKPDLKKIDIVSSIQDAIAQLKFPENVSLTTKFSEVPTIEADSDQLRRVFQNIALNGAQAMPDGGELTVSTRKDGDFVEAEFADTGVGIPAENVEKLFTPLFTTKAQGVGLGLAICKNIVEAHNGRIELKSKVGEGSTFTVKLPIHQNKGGEKKT